MNGNKIPHRITLFFHSEDRNKTVSIVATQKFYYPYRLQKKDLLKPSLIYSKGVGIPIKSIEVLLDDGLINVFSRNTGIGDYEVTGETIVDFIDALIVDNWSIEANVSGIRYDKNGGMDAVKQAILKRFEFLEGLSK